MSTFNPNDPKVKLYRGSETREVPREFVDYLTGKKQSAGEYIPNPYSLDTPKNKLSTDFSTPTKRPVYETKMSPYQKAQEDFYNRPQQVNEASIREQEMERARQQIEATKGVYLAELQKLQQQGEARMKETTAIGLGRGLAGTPFTQAQKESTQDYTNQIVGARQAERQAEIARIMSKGNDRAEKMYQARRQEFENDYDRAYHVD